MKIRQKLFCGLGSFMLLMGLVGSVVTLYSINIKTHLNQLVLSNLNKVDGATKIAYHIQRTKSNIRELFLETHEEQLGESEERWEIEHATNAIKKSLSAMQEYGLVWENTIKAGIELEEKNRKELESFEAMKIKLDQFMALTHELLLVYEKQGCEISEDFFEDNIEPLSRELQTTVKNLEIQIKQETIVTTKKIETLARDSAKTSVLLTIGTLLITITLGWAFSNSITVSIAKLCAAATEIGNGHLDTKVDITSSDEIGQLADSFNIMAEDLKKSTTSIDHLNEEITERKEMEDSLKKNREYLEQRVEERTSELLQKNEQLEREVASRVLAEGELSRAAFHDTLTGLPNRALLLDRLTCLIDRARRRDDTLFALLYMDLDRFKIINDSLGHQYGDELLIEVGKRLERCVLAGDTVARLGGDEFTVLLDEIKDFSQAMEIADRILGELSSPINIMNETFSITASIGIVIVASAGQIGPEELLRDADTAMYRAKGMGKNCYQLFDMSMQETVQQRLELERALQQALKQEEFVLHYQPIVSLITGELEGFEALVRWQHPGEGLVPPVKFISICEETGLIVHLGQWVLQKACEQMRTWQKQFQLNTPLTICVNLSAKQFAQEHLVDQINQTLRQASLDPRSLNLEITESMVMDNPESAVAILTELKKLGVQLSIDDFGTGYSSLGSLHKFPIDTLKIDRSFVTQLRESEENARIIETIVLLAKNLELTTTVEGIETTEELDYLRKLGCEKGQGYLFAKPLDRKDAEQLIETYSLNGVSGIFA